MKRQVKFLQNLESIKLIRVIRKPFPPRSRRWKAFQSSRLLAIASFLLCLLLLPHPAGSHSKNSRNVLEQWRETAVVPTAYPNSVTRFMAQSESSAGDPENLMQQGREFYTTGRLIEAAEILEQAVQQYQQQGDTLRQAMALSNLALVYQKSGLFPVATQAIAASLDLLESDRSNHLVPESQHRLRVLAQTLEIQGSLHFEQGQSEAALATWQHSEAVYTQLNDTSGILRSQMNQAQALQVLGFYRRALTLLTELNHNLQSQPTAVTKVVNLRSLGEALRFTGDLDQSLQVLQTGLELAQQLQLPQETAATLLSLGNTASVQQDVEGALHFYQQAAAIAPASLIAVQAHINQLSLLVNTHQVPDAQLMSRIISELADLPVSETKIYAMIHLAQILIRLADPNNPQTTPDVIAQLLTAAVQHSHRLGDPRAESYALGSLGGLYEQTQQWEDASDLTQQALQLATRMNASDIAYRWYWQMGRLLKQQGDIAGAIAAYDTAIAELQFLRNDLLAVNQEVQFSFRDSVEPIYRQSIELLLQAQTFEDEQAHEQLLDKARQRVEALQLAELDNFFREACLDATTVSLDNLVDANNSTAAILYPIILPNQLQVIVKIPGQSLQHHVVNQPQVEVERVLTQLRQSITEPDTIVEVKSLAQQLYGWLIQPIEAQLVQQQIQTLVFVLDGALRSVPMAVLYDGQQYLVEKYAIALSPGLQLLKPAPIAQKRLQVLAAGLVQPPPNFQYLPPLPEIHSEFALISETGVPMTTLLNQEFTSEMLESKVKQTTFNILHLATHGQFSSKAEDTFVLAADGPINVTQFDTFLQRQDETRLQAIELLVLSACQTAAGDNRATLGLAGVAVRAGARSTLASLWNIGDRSTAILMGEFYQELANSQITKAEALRRAQVTLLQQYPNYSRPGYWAAYVLVGNWL